MRIKIEVIPHNHQRYDTVGDWQWDEFGNLFIKVSDLNHQRINRVIRETNPERHFEKGPNMAYYEPQIEKDTSGECLIAIHELIEAVLCRFNFPEITGEEVDKFDMGPGKKLADPGDDQRAPYHRQHLCASVVERLIAKELNINWQEYEKRIGYLPRNK